MRTGGHPERSWDVQDTILGDLLKKSASPVSRNLTMVDQLLGIRSLFHHCYTWGGGAGVKNLRLSNDSIMQKFFFRVALYSNGYKET